MIRDRQDASIRDVEKCTRVYLHIEEKEAVRWAEIEERLKHGKALHEAAERSDLAIL